jgi:hypothetical protein
LLVPVSPPLRQPSPCRTTRSLSFTNDVWSANSTPLPRVPLPRVCFGPPGHCRDGLRCGSSPEGGHGAYRGDSRQPGTSTSETVRESETIRGRWVVDRHHHLRGGQCRVEPRRANVRVGTHSAGMQDFWRSTLVPFDRETVSRPPRLFTLMTLFHSVGDLPTEWNIRVVVLQWGCWFGASQADLVSR